MRKTETLPFTCLNCSKHGMYKTNSTDGKFCSMSCRDIYNWEMFGRLRVVLGKGGNVKRYLIEEFGHKCSSCLSTSWCGKPIPLKIDFIDGNHKNKDLANLKLVCPNCLCQVSQANSNQ